MGSAGSGPRSWSPTGSREFRLVGLLNDDSNPVGSVHLGVVFEVEAAGRPVEVRERDKLTRSLRHVRRGPAAWDRMETWSRLVATACSESQRPFGGVTRILDRCFGCGAPSRSAPLLLGLSRWRASASRPTTDVVRLQLTGVIDQVNAAYIEEGLASRRRRRAPRRS